MLTRDQLEATYLEHLAAAREHLDGARRSSNGIAKGTHIAQALVEAQLATAAATALANNGCTCTPCLEARA